MAKNKKTRQNKCENTITQTARQKQYIKTKMAKKYKDAKSEKTMVNKLFNAALQLASYRKSKTHYKRHPVLTHARKTGYNPRYSCWILYAPYANEPKYKQNYKKTHHHW